MLKLPQSGAILNYIFDWDLDVREARLFLFQGSAGRTVLQRSIRHAYCPAGQITTVQPGFQARFILGTVDLESIDPEQGALRSAVQVQLATGQRVVPPETVIPARILRLEMPVPA